MTKTDVSICRANGWKVGDILEGDEGYGPDRILLTAIGERIILARKISRNGKPIESVEGPWTLQLRHWKKVN